MMYYPRYDKAYLFGNAIALITSTLLVLTACWLMLSFAQSLRSQSHLESNSLRIDTHQSVKQQTVTVVHTTEATDPRYYYSDYR